MKNKQKVICKTGIVYRTTNKVNGMMYVGMLRAGNLSLRKTYLGSGILLKEAIEEFGRSNFEKEILWEGPIDETPMMEEFYLNKFDVVESDMYYNQVNKSHSFNGVGVPKSSDTKKKMSLASKGKKKSDEHRKKMSEARKGKLQSVEAKEKMSKEGKGRRWLNNGEVNVKVKPEVIQEYLSDGYVFGRV